MGGVLEVPCHGESRAAVGDEHGFWKGEGVYIPSGLVCGNILLRSNRQLANHRTSSKIEDLSLLSLHVLERRLVLKPVEHFARRSGLC